MKQNLPALLVTVSAGFMIVGAIPAHAKGCLTGAAVGGVAGHAAGHGVLGAAGGCAVGHHMANKQAKATNAKAPQQQSTTDEGQTH